ncbi:MAG TPA: L,D-transpeptidase [Candidatus Angelobacter sp.]|nr:L,D-transpeptidase [Candidatus Angelobacter sp.]
MRRLVVLPVKTSAIAAIVLAGAVYVAAEARQAVVRRQELELAQLEGSFDGIPVAVNPVIGANRVIGRSGDRMIAAQPANLTAKTSRSYVSQPESKPDMSSSSQTSPADARPATDEHSRLILISIPDRRLALLEDGKLIKTYPVAVGRRWAPSPEGDFTIINHAVNPVYRHKGKEIQPGKENPLGDRWMGLSLKGYGIHGTNVPSSIGKAVSHGCFRMARRDVEDLYSRVSVGDHVIVRRERDELIAQIFAPQDAPASSTAATEEQTASASIASTESVTATVAIAQQ